MKSQKYLYRSFLSLITCVFFSTGSTFRLQAQEAAPVKLNGRYITVNNARLWVEMEGKGAPLFLLAGGPGNSHHYLHNFARMRKHNLLVYIDGFGRGRSDTAKKVSDYSLSRDVEDIEGIRKALGFEKINVLGHSYGGVVAQGYAVKYPEKTERLILANTFFSGEMWQANDDNCNHEIRTNYPELWEQLMKLRIEGAKSADREHNKLYSQVPYGFLYAYNAGKFEKSTADSLYPDENEFPHPNLFNTKLYYQLVGEDGDFIIGGDIARMDFRKDLHKLPMPVLIYTGRYDRVAVPRLAILYKKYAPQASFVMFEKSGHNPQIEEPEKLFPLLETFLKK